MYSRMATIEIDTSPTGSASTDSPVFEQQASMGRVKQNIVVTSADAVLVNGVNVREAIIHLEELSAHMDGATGGSGGPGPASTLSSTTAISGVHGGAMVLGRAGTDLVLRAPQGSVLFNGVDVAVRLHMLDALPS